MFCRSQRHNHIACNTLSISCQSCGHATFSFFLFFHGSAVFAMLTFYFFIFFILFLFRACVRTCVRACVCLRVFLPLPRQNSEHDDYSLHFPDSRYFVPAHAAVMQISQALEGTVLGQSMPL